MGDGSTAAAEFSILLLRLSEKGKMITTIIVVVNTRVEHIFAIYIYIHTMHYYVYCMYVCIHSKRLGDKNDGGRIACLCPFPSRKRRSRCFSA